ncbi:serine/threonine-protein kinase [Calothrix sp. 336/3]|uniref:serine/threonine-protein kinase n=1 Tax=Calothrix sp. 336/3 TaxID=1337936 RepID=UPI0004E34AFC|nr:serine/threonine-protein kinase [Calothrix sp. 336/3]AKG22471.1 serine/threonine protein kinase [Calothrix sp. 336/3]
MLCCLNPDCEKPDNEESQKYCQNCGTPLIPLLRGHYRILRRLSEEGGFGLTYLAEDVDRLNEVCVVKQLAPKFHGTSALKKAVELFKEEAQRLQQLGEHPQIPRLLAYFEQENHLYLVQEFIDGENLLDELKKGFVYREEDIKAILQDLLPVLKFIHDQGVIHRDIKPQNIMRRRSDRQLVLIDFGASKQLTATVQTRMGTTIGSHGYTAIEQMQGGEAYPASDLYSLGATCFHLLANISPYELWLKQGYSWVNSWQTYLIKNEIQVSDQLIHILDKLLKIELKERYATDAEVIADLQPPEEVKVATSVKTESEAAEKHSILNYKYVTALGTFTLILMGWGIWNLSRNPSPNMTSSTERKVNQVVLNSSASFFQPQSLKGHSSDVNAVVFTARGDKILSASDDEKVKVWDAVTGKKLQTFNTHVKATNYLYALAVSPNGEYVATGGYDDSISLWNMSTGQKIKTLTGHSGDIASLAFSPDGNFLASGSLDETIKIWDVNTGNNLQTLAANTGSIYTLAFHPTNSDILASGSKDKTIRLWNVKSGKLMQTLRGHSDIVSSLAFSPDGQAIASASKDKTIKIWNVTKGEVSRTIAQHSARVNTVIFLRGENSLMLASGSHDETIRFWDANTGAEIKLIKGDNSGRIHAIAASPDGKILVSGGSAGNTLNLWQMKF